MWAAMGWLIDFAQEDEASAAHESPTMWLTIGQAAIQLGVSIDTLRRWDTNGKLPAERDGNKRRVYSRRQIDKHEQTRKQANA